jgi:hypothetical protein
MITMVTTISYYGSNHNLKLLIQLTATAVKQEARDSILLYAFILQWYNFLSFPTDSVPNFLDAFWMLFITGIIHDGGSYILSWFLGLVF